MDLFIISETQNFESEMAGCEEPNLSIQSFHQCASLVLIKLNSLTFKIDVHKSFH